MPGVEFHANIIENLLHGGFLRYGGLRWTYAAIAFFALFCGVFSGALFRLAGALWAIAAVVCYARPGPRALSSSAT